MEKIGKIIKQQRELHKLSQQNLAEKLNLSRSAVSAIETGTRNLTALELTKLADIFQLSLDELVYGEKYEIEITPEAKSTTPKLRISVPQHNYLKFKEVLIYILSKVGAQPNIGQTVLYKLLYFCDFDYYEKYEEQMIGATYIKNKFGPTPLEFSKLVKEMQSEGELVEIDNKYFEFKQKKYLPTREADLSRLNANEIRLINEVMARLAHFNAQQISEYSHEDIPWKYSEMGKIIDYESVFYRTSAYSVRSYSNSLE